MKKCLLIIIAATAVNATAQTRRLVLVNPSQIATSPAKNAVYAEPVNPTPITSVHVRPNATHRSGSGNHTQATVVSLGSAGNAFTCAFGPKTYLWYDKDINSLTFSHRSNPTAFPSIVTTGALMFDRSIDGGNTWTNDVGPVYSNYLNDHRARYPQGLIYNPIGNTDPNNAFFTNYAPITNGTNWIENVHGTSGLTVLDSVWTREALNATGTLQALIPDGFQIVKNTGIVWNSSQNVVDANVSVNLLYNDLITMSQGTWNGSNEFNYTHSEINARMDKCASVAGLAADTPRYVGHAMAWSDDGLTGYVSVIGNDFVTTTGDSTYFLINYKTADGGLTWFELPTPNISDVDSLLLAGNFLYTCAFQNDAVVDANGNLHVVVAIGPRPGGDDGAWSVVTAYSNWGIFDIYTTDGGWTWRAKLLDKPQTFRGTFGDGSTANPTLSEDSRPQASRTWDGSKLFFTWFDTDTLEFGVTTNTFPDAKCIGYDLASNQWTNVSDLTDLTNADGLCTFGNVSYYVIETGGSFGIPIVYQTLIDPIQTGSPTTFFYVNGASISTFNQPGGDVALRTYINVGVPSVNGIASFSVSANYPNPFAGKTSVDVSLAQPSDVTIEVSNMIGQILSVKNYSNLHSGVNTLAIDGSNLAKGLYMYKVKAGNEVVTKTLSVD